MDDTTLSSPFDIIVRGDSLYVTNRGGKDGEKILMLDKNTMVITGAYGSGNTTTPSTRTGEFYGPYRFVGILNKGLSIIDDLGGYGATNLDRIIFMNNINGDGWHEYGSNGTGTDQFGFYAGC